MTGFNSLSFVTAFLTSLAEQRSFARGFNVFFKGDDWRGTEKGLRLEREFAAVGVEVVYFPYTMHTSSRQLRRALDAASAPKEARGL